MCLSAYVRFLFSENRCFFFSAGKTFFSRRAPATARRQHGEKILRERKKAYYRKFFRPRWMNNLFHPPPYWLYTGGKKSRRQYVEQLREYLFADHYYVKRECENIMLPPRKLKLDFFQPRARRLFLTSRRNKGLNGYLSSTKKSVGLKSAAQDVELKVFRKGIYLFYPILNLKRKWKKCRTRIGQKI